MTTCQTCGAETDAYLCSDCADCRRATDKRCGRCLADLLAQLPAGIRDLQTAATRQAKVGNIPLRLSADALADMELADAEERDVAAWLRSRQGRIALVATGSPVAYDAAKLHGEAVNAVITWSRHIAETRDVVIPGSRTTSTRYLAIDRNRAAWRTRTWTFAPTIESLCTWLLTNLDSIRLDEAAGQMHTKLADLSLWIERTVDRRPPQVFVGPCTARDVRTDAVPMLGAPCSTLTCPHESCDGIRRGEHALAPVVVECGHALLATQGASEVTCEACGTDYVIADHRAVIADKIADKLGTLSEVAGYLRTLTIDVGGEAVPLEMSVDRIKGWLSRGRISERGTNPNGHKLVSVGEVRAYAEDWTRRRAARRKITAA